MPAGLICDFCTKAEAERDAVNWYRVDAAGGTVIHGWGDKGIEGTYCSAGCLAQRACVVAGLMVA